MDVVVERAYKAAKSHYPPGEWEWLEPRQRVADIYAEMRRIDAEEYAAARPSPRKASLKSSTYL